MIRAKAEAKKGKRERPEAEARAQAVTADPSKAKRFEVQDGRKQNNKGVDIEVFIRQLQKRELWLSQTKMKC